MKASWVSVEDDPDGARPKAKDAGANVGKNLGKASVRDMASELLI